MENNDVGYAKNPKSDLEGINNGVTSGTKENGAEILTFVDSQTLNEDGLGSLSNNGVLCGQKNGIPTCEELYGLSLIATQIGNPIMLDAFTSAMCVEAWGQISFARALIEVSANKELKPEVTMSIPKGEDERACHTLKPINGVSHNKNFVGFRVNNNKNLRYQPVKPKVNEPKQKQPGKEDRGKGIETQNPFDHFADQDENVCGTSIGESSSNGMKLKNLFEKLNDITTIVDPNSDTRKEDFVKKSEALDDQCNDETDSDVEDIYGCRIILGWNIDMVNVVVLSQTSKAIHVEIMHKASNKIMYCSFIYAALNLEDNHFRSSSLNTSMMEFKDCVADIEVMDINCSEIEWLAVGDSNSAYFHKSLKIRNQQSRIDVILSADNIELTGPSVHDAFVKHYEMFLGTHMYCEDLNCDGLFSNVVSDQTCSNMVRNVTDVEIKAAMFSVGDDKASGLDGYTSTFFKKGWNIVGQDMYKAVRDILTMGVILKRFGFHPIMKKWIMACVSSTYFSIGVDGDVHRFFKGKRGLRDDVDSALVIMEFLEEFKRASGLVPSLPKSTTYFCNVMNHVKIAILNIMTFSEGKLPVIYLGIPLILTRLFNRDCKCLVEKAKNKIHDWKNKSLSFTGRLQLCKFVISSMHVYWASVLMISTGILLDIEQLIRGFLWCNGELKCGKAKVAWNNICLPKIERGLGICSLELFNIALKTTHIWNIVSNKESLWVRWVHTYKLKGRSFWGVPLKCDVSWGWLKLLQIRDFVSHISGLKLETVVVFLLGLMCGVRNALLFVTFLIGIFQGRASILKPLLNGCGSTLFRRHSAFLQPISHLRTAVKRSSNDIHDIIMVTVRLKLLTFRFKNKAKVHDAIANDILDDLLKNDKKNVTQMKIQDLIEMRIDKYGQHLNKEKQMMHINKGKEKIVMERDDQRTIYKGRRWSSIRNAAITKPVKPKSRSKHLAPTTRTRSTCTTLVVPTKRPPPVMNSVLGLAAVTTWQRILNKEFGIISSKEDVGGSSNVRSKGKRKML
uniref:RNA-directed DNA polymerase, eukaryota, reverse transcriptase zinc-binding domain protein n=1 Tax=Tanacetum cinerariifolium TaxID=118510 RepID=A0A6L2NPK8_TANCI|nr:hypothetical protein [Tanacetum cinerariifolium]